MADETSYKLKESEISQSEESDTQRYSIKFFLTTVFHLVYLTVNLTILINAIIILCSLTDENLEKEPIQNMCYYAFFFITNWNYYLCQLPFLILAVYCDILQWRNNNRSVKAMKIFYWRDVIFSALAVPFTGLVFLLFWSLYAIDRELVFPKVYDEVVPWWFNHAVHSNILVMVILETILVPRRHPQDSKMEIRLNAGFGITYTSLFFILYFITGRWMYPVFNMMNWWQICLFELYIFGADCFFFYIQYPLNRLVHGKERTLDRPADSSLM